MIIRIRHLWVWAAAVAVVMVAGASLPAAAAPELQISADGTTWTEEGAPLRFQESTWVPGDTDSASLWVRNATQNAVDVRAKVILKDAASLPAGVTMTMTFGDEKPMSVTRSGQVAGAIALKAGQKAEATLTAAVGDDATMDRTSTIAIVFEGQGNGERTDIVDSNQTPDGSLSGFDGGMAAGDQDAEDQHPDGMLPGTGAPDVAWLLVMGALLAGTGLMIVVRRRRDLDDGEGRQG